MEHTDLQLRFGTPQRSENGTMDADVYSPRTACYGAIGLTTDSSVGAVDTTPWAGVFTCC